jgi:hypothetical protein
MLSPRIALLLITALTSGCGSWHIKDAAGVRRCTVQSGWTQPTVRSHCGDPSHHGWQRKTGDWSLHGLRMCSAPVDIYDCTFVMYNCDGLVKGVSRGWPAESIEAPDVTDCK